MNSRSSRPHGAAWRERFLAIARQVPASPGASAGPRRAGLRARAGLRPRLSAARGA